MPLLNHHTNEEIGVLVPCLLTYLPREQQNLHANIGTL